MRFWLLFALLPALAPLYAQDFDPAEFFGPGHFQRAQEDPHTGTLNLSLSGEMPPFVDFYSSGEGDFADRFKPAASGLAIAADSTNHRTCEIALDFGVTRLDGKVTIVELEKGTLLAWHLHALDAAKDREFLAEVRHGSDGRVTLQVRVGDGTTFKLVPGSSVSAPALELPCEFTLQVAGDKLSATLGKLQTSIDAKVEAGHRAGLAVSDGRARLKQWQVSGLLAPAWVADAAQRLAAQKALRRLRELSVGGLLGGVSRHPYNQTATDLAGFTQEQKDVRQRALGHTPGARAQALVNLATALPANALAQFEAGVYALLAGDVQAGVRLLQAAQALRKDSQTGLALAEGLRRLGQLSGAETALAAARTDLPQDLAPEYELLLGRLQAAKGQLPKAAQTLQAASTKYPDNAELQSFALSAQSLTSPQNLTRLAATGPLGLTVLSDLPEKSVLTLTARAAPYLEKFRRWLPGLARKLEGTLVIYAGPVDYLNAALIVAGDNLDNVAGMYLPACIDGKPTVLACRGFGEDELLRTLVHELWHLAFAASGQAETAPRWLNEGMAVYLSAGRVAGGIMRFDRLPAEFSPEFTAPPLADLQRALQARGIDFYLPEAISQNYAAAWALVWLLAETESALLPRLLAGDAAAATDLPRQLQALQVALGDRLAKLEKDP
ncbi:MAG: hypothetical protein IPP14_07065 [Planctomycetes bacterium]|nr:hypothetical protein [Planctomycetota bacterium]